MTRLHRVRAFCDWLESIPLTPPYHEQPGFRFFADLTDGEILAAQVLIRARTQVFARAALAADAEGRFPMNDDDPKPRGAA